MFHRCLSSQKAIKVIFRFKYTSPCFWMNIYNQALLVAKITTLRMLFCLVFKINASERHYWHSLRYPLKPSPLLCPFFWPTSEGSQFGLRDTLLENGPDFVERLYCLPQTRPRVFASMLFTLRRVPWKFRPFTLNVSKITETYLYITFICKLIEVIFFICGVLWRLHILLLWFFFPDWPRLLLLNSWNPM